MQKEIFVQNCIKKIFKLKKSQIIYLKELESNFLIYKKNKIKKKPKTKRKY